MGKIRIIDWPDHPMFNMFVLDIKGESDENYFFEFGDESYSVPKKYTQKIESEDKRGSLL